MHKYLIQQLVMVSFVSWLPSFHTCCPLFFFFSRVYFLLNVLKRQILMTTPSRSRAHTFRDSRSPFDFAPAQCSLPSSRSVDESRLGHSACPGTLSTCNYTRTPFPTHPNEAAGDAATPHSRHIDEGHGLK